MQTKVIFEDAHVLVCHKPAGLATQSGRVGQADVISELKNYLMAQVSGNAVKGSSTGKEVPYLGVVHRLDQPVEGLLVFAKTQKAAAHLTKQLSKGSLNKQYYAVVCGKPACQAGELVDYMIKDGNVARIVERPGGTGNVKRVANTQDKVSNGENQAKKAVLQYRVVSTMQSESNQCLNQVVQDTAEGMLKACTHVISLLDIHIDTGRFHQIRAQMSHAGYPLLGDSKYGTGESVCLSKKMNIRNVALYAYKIVFEHPDSGKKLEFAMEPKLPISFGNIN